MNAFATLLELTGFPSVAFTTADAALLVAFMAAAVRLPAAEETIFVVFSFSMTVLIVVFNA
ncbi:hypothetical protein [Vulcanisaeta sp. JCM 16159]|uniref:hypothetical protein n=1 Tax=Vulcanisaeta sp. JCM 16159 TaxID=1295371 RepID=UPI000AB6D898|nr:hypothetical protein [Vulcanisaeta sp. JCM 16159]